MKIETMNHIHIAYMRSIGEYGMKNKEIMEHFKEFLLQKKLLEKHSIILGIAMDNPSLTPVDELRYDVGIVIDDVVEGLDYRTIDNGDYAIFEVEHTVDGVKSFWKNIMYKTRDLEIEDTRPVIERYTMDKVEKNICEFCVPLKNDWNKA